MNKKWLFFDFDGTLVDLDIDWNKIKNEDERYMTEMSCIIFGDYEKKEEVNKFIEYSDMKIAIFSNNFEDTIRSFLDKEWIADDVYFISGRSKETKLKRIKDFMKKKKLKYSDAVFFTDSKTEHDKIEDTVSTVLIKYE